MIARRQPAAELDDERPRDALRPTHEEPIDLERPKREERLRLCRVPKVELLGPRGLCVPFDGFWIVVASIASLLLVGTGTEREDRRLRYAVERHAMLAPRRGWTIKRIGFLGPSVT